MGGIIAEPGHYSESMKRACDRCIIRKVKCDGRQPCQRCEAGRPQHSCTYLKLARKRGPKSSKSPLLRRPWKDRSRSAIQQRPSLETEDDLERGKLYDEHLEQQHVQDERVSSADPPAIIAGSNPFDNLPRRTSITVLDPLSESHSLCGRSTVPPSHYKIPFRILHASIEAYRSRMYPVWPVVDVEMLMRQLQEPNHSLDIYVLATSLCAATMAQLNLSPIENSCASFTSENMEKECIEARLACDYREHPNVNQVLVSFFLHVYHAKLDRRKAALSYVQESLSLARLLNLADDTSPCDDGSESVVEKRILYLLLWVSERGYAIQHALPISSNNTISLPPFDSYEGNVYVQGLLNLATLFVAFDSSSIPRFSRYGAFPLSTKQLVAVEKTLVDTPLPPPQFNAVQRIDFLVTKQWMRILLWQQAMSRGLLSSNAYTKSMTFSFPAQIAPDLLRWMVLFSTDNLMPLGRDQLVKLFEITNTLADVILCNPQISLVTGNRELGPLDFLHAVYQIILPVLELDPFFSSILREKTAEALLRAPSRVFASNPEFSPESERDMYSDDMPVI